MATNETPQEETTEVSRDACVACNMMKDGCRMNDVSFHFLIEITVRVGCSIHGPVHKLWRTRGRYTRFTVLFITSAHSNAAA